MPMFIGIQISRVLFQVATNMEIIESAGNEGHACMRCNGSASERKIGFSLMDDLLNDSLSPRIAGLSSNILT